ncbi:DUF3169 family protein [Streptococcus iniae]|nr:DUF3169 family protein [Streptococcus iniae]OHX26680.1 hypothetical protein BKX95_09165 [Streptococcus iniae]
MTISKNTFLRLLKVLFLSSLCGAIIGGLIGFFNETLLDIFNEIISFKETFVSLIIIFSHITVGISLLTAFLFLFQLKKDCLNYQDIKDDDTTENNYRTLNKKHSHASLLIAMSSILTLFNIMTGIKFDFGADDANLSLPILDFLILPILIFAQAIAMKRYNNIRGTNIPLFPNTKELKNNILKMDEAELQANYKMSFDTILYLNTIIIPTLYVFLFFIYLISGILELTAILLLLIIQLYILFMNLEMTKSFYR